MNFKHSGIEGQIKKVPKKVIWCKKCTYSNQRPRIILYDDNICSACYYAEYKKRLIGNSEKKNYCLY